MTWPNGSSRIYLSTVTELTKPLRMLGSKIRGNPINLVPSACPF
jgi:hypothetical protein